MDRRRPDVARATAALLAAVTAGAAVAQIGRGLRAFQATDAVAFQAAGRIIGDHGCIYCLGTEKSMQMTLLGGQVQANGVKPFDNPPIVAWLVQPLAGSDLATYTRISVLLAAVALLVAAVVAVRVIATNKAVRLELPAVVVALALIAPLPGLETLIFAQWDGLMLVALVCSYLLLRAGYGFAAGLALSFLLIKPQDVWLVPVVLAVGFAWPALRGFIVGGGVWLLSSLVLVNIDTLRHIADSLSQSRFETQDTVGLPGIGSAIGGSTWGFVVAGGGLLAVAATWFLRDRLRHDPLLAIDIGIGLSLLFSPHVFSHDLLLLGAVLVDIGRRNLSIAIFAALLLDAAYLVEDPLFHTRGHVQALALVGVVFLVAAVAIRERPKEFVPALSAGFGASRAE